MGIVGKGELTSLALARSAFADFCSRPVEDRCGEVVAAEQVELQRFLDQVRLECSRVAVELDDTGHYETTDCTSTGEWMAKNCHMSHFEACEELLVGPHPEELPEAGGHVAAGRLGFGHLRVLARTAAKIERSATSESFDERDLL